MLRRPLSRGIHETADSHTGAPSAGASTAHSLVQGAPPAAPDAPPRFALLEVVRGLAGDLLTTEQRGALARRHAGSPCGAGGAGEPARRARAVRRCGGLPGASGCPECPGRTRSVRPGCGGARAAFRKSLDLCRRIGGNLAHWRRDLAEAGERHARALAIRREFGDQRGVALSSLSLGILAMERGDFAGAEALLRESLAAQREAGDQTMLDVTLENFARAPEGAAPLPRPFVCACAQRPRRCGRPVAQRCPTIAAWCWTTRRLPCVP